MNNTFTLLLSFVFAFLVFQPPLQAQAQGSPLAMAPRKQPDTDKSLHFIENKNQWDAKVKFMAPIPGGKLYLQNQGFMFAFYDYSQIAHKHGATAASQTKTNKVKAHAYSVSFLGAATTPQLTGKNAAAALRNYFIGNDRSRWASGVKAYEEINYQALYPGIDLHLYENKQHLKYEFLVQPNTNPAAIRMQYQGADQLTLKDGELHIKTTLGEVVEQKPYAYQTINNVPVPVPCTFKLEQDVITFVFPSGYDTSQLLVIDPTLVFSTFSGSQADNWGFTATYDQDGNMYSGGIVDGIGFPARVGAFDISWNGGNQRENTAWDIGILKYNTNAAGAASLLYATYLGGSDSEIPSSLVVNSKNELLILGSTGSPDFPVTPGAHDQSFNQGANTNPLSGISFSQGTDIFVTRLTANGSVLIASTFLGGSGNDGLVGTEAVPELGIQQSALVKNYGDQFRGDILTDSLDNVYVVSATQSINFPVRGGFQNRNRSGETDAVVAKFTPGLVLTWSSYLGGSGADAAYSVQIDTNGGILVAGGTTSSDLNGTTGAFRSGYQGGQSDGFVAKISNNGALLERLSYIGTANYDQTFFVQLDTNNDVYLLGQSLGSYPVSAGVFSTPNGKQFIQKLNNDLSASLFSTVFGATNAPANSLINISPTAFLVDDCSRIYVCGWGANTTNYDNGTTDNLPVTADAYQKTTDGKDFYLMLLSQDAKALEYATFIGANTPQAEHVDGGTSRFDKRGFVYQAVCGGCRRTSEFPTTPGAWSRTNQSLNCNNAAFKFNVNIQTAEAGPDETFCADQDPFQLTGFTPATGGTWSGPGVSPTGLFTPSPDLIGTVTLTYTVANGSCTSTSTKIITLNPVPVLTFAPLPPTTCLPAAPITLVATPLGGTFTGAGITGNIFDPTAAGAGTHTITYTFTTDAGCTVTSTQTVAINVTPEVEAGPNERICSGSFPVMLSSFSPAGGAWSGTGVASNGLFTPSEAIVGTHVLTYTVTNGFCSTSKTKTVIVDPTVKFTQGLAIAVCPDAPAFQIPAIIPPGGTWSGNGVTPGGIFTPTPGRAGSDTLTYFVTVGACSGVSSQVVNIAAPPVIQAGAVPTECGTDISIQGFAPFTANFTNNTTGATGYLWEFGDGTTSTEAIPTQLYAKDGQYEVNLTVFYSNGCSLKQKIAAVLVDKSRLVPNVFTPNSDGLNDTFVPRITCLPTDLKIFNRWGQLIYEKKNYQNTWGGENTSDGIYYYQLTSSKGQIWKGWVEIIR